jgi:ElaB/YqjD/DUF883 family membrane-anchored ribosome-binding protein
MDNQAEVILQQMEETKGDMADKLESLEQQVMQTVHDATEAVETVKDAVQNTVASVKESMEDTVTAVKDVFDLPAHVDRHPWAMMAGGVAVGYLASYLLHRGGTGREPSATVAPVRPTNSARASPAPNGAAESRWPQTATAAGQLPAADLEPTSSSWTGSLGSSFGTELSKLKGLAIGTMMGLARDLISEGAPRELGAQIREVMDGMTVKLGGQPIRGPVLAKEDPVPDPTT